MLLAVSSFKVTYDAGNDSVAHIHHDQVETEGTVDEWAQVTFGVGTPERIFERMLEELEELRACPPEKRDEEIADVLICLMRYARARDLDLGKLVVDKMEVNRKRRWRSNGDGTGQHVRPLKATELHKVPEGALLEITWSGGNGPHLYRMAFEDVSDIGVNEPVAYPTQALPGGGIEELPPRSERNHHVWIPLLDGNIGEAPLTEVRWIE